MKYNKIVKAKFIRRPNRFIAHVEIDGKEEVVHVKNTGRCRELLQPGTTVYLSQSDNPLRKTKYDLVAVEKIRQGKMPLLVNMDSQIPNAAAEEWLKKGNILTKGAYIKREFTHGNSRFDFYAEDGSKKIFIEVKGVTLENDGVASFPDAPTERGVKHLKELADCVKQGYEAYILFVIQMKEISLLRPNDEMHKAFGDALRAASAAGVHIVAQDCIVTPDSMELDAPVKVSL